MILTAVTGPVPVTARRQVIAVPGAVAVVVVTTGPPSFLAAGELGALGAAHTVTAKEVGAGAEPSAVLPAKALAVRPVVAAPAGLSPATTGLGAAAHGHGRVDPAAGPSKVLVASVGPEPAGAPVASLVAVTAASVRKVAASTAATPSPVPLAFLLPRAVH